MINIFTSLRFYNDNKLGTVFSVLITYSKQHKKILDLTFDNNKIRFYLLRIGMNPEELSKDIGSYSVSEQNGILLKETHYLYFGKSKFMHPLNLLEKQVFTITRIIKRKK